MLKFVYEKYKALNSKTYKNIMSNYSYLNFFKMSIISKDIKTTQNKSNKYV